MATQPDPSLNDGIVTEPKPAASAAPKPKGGLSTLSPLNQRRWRNCKKSRRAYWSHWIFGIQFGLSLFAEFLAYD